MPWFYPVLAMVEEAPSANPSLILAGVLLSLVVIYFASKLGGELCTRVNLPSVLGELVGGVVIGVSAFKLLVFPEGGLGAEDSLIIQLYRRQLILHRGRKKLPFTP